MAIKFIEQIGDGLLGFWEITETEEQLLASIELKKDDLDRIILFRNESRKKEWLAARILLQAMTNSDATIGYTPSGKPYPVNLTGNISISHSTKCVVLFYHPLLQPGVDIELITRNVNKIARKFLSPKEREDCTIQGIPSNGDMMLRWCAKEAVFKMVPDSDIDFASQILCTALPLKASEGRLTATFFNASASIQIPLQFRCLGDMLLVWGTLPEN
jgi:phosphopantetheinyl transferase